MLASPTRPSCAGALPQELGHWFCSQIVFWNSLLEWLPDDQQRLKLGLKLELCSLTNGLQRFYLLRKPRIKFNKLCWVWILFRTPKLRTAVSWYQPSPTRLLWGSLGPDLLFALYQSSGLNSNCKLKFTKVLADLCLPGTRQDFSSWLTGSNLLFAVSTYGMGKEGQKSSVLSLAGLLLMAECDSHSKDWPALAKMLN